MSGAGDWCGCCFEDVPYLSVTCGATLTLFMGLLESVLRSRSDIADPCRRMGRPDHDLHGKAFDFVVVGAGVAGPVVAGRLAENLDWSVLLLEAGPEEPTATQVPAFASSGVGTPLDWNYTTVVQKNACLNKGGVCSWPRGKLVGGSNALNGMMYMRGNPAIYDEFEANGNKGWGWTGVLPYFIKSERNLNPEEVDEGYHGSDGPVVIQHYASRPALAEGVIAAGEELGYRRGDLNGRNQTGVNVAQMMQKDGLRMTTARAYLRPKVGQKNIKLATKSQVTRVIIDPESKRAIGVEFIDTNGNTNMVYANKEVILSAGTVGSPQLLLLSGVGPKNDLEELGIKVVQDLPVGRNVRNHVSVGVGFTINETSTRTLTMEAFNEFLTSRTGNMASTGLTQTTAFLVSKYATDGIPDLQVFFDGYGAGCSRTGLPEECTDGTLSDAQGSSCGRRNINARPTNVRPKSVGTLRLRSTHPLDYPLIDPQYLTDEQDVQVLVEGIKLLINFTKTKALAPWDFVLSTTPVAGCENIEFGTDEYFACVVRRATGPENHQVGTCRMGPEGDRDAVVDPELRVRGIQGLRVVDASIFPITPNSNTVGPILMAGEKAADIIKTTWKNTLNPTQRPARPPPFPYPNRPAPFHRLHRL